MKTRGNWLEYFAIAGAVLVVSLAVPAQQRPPGPPPSDEQMMFEPAGPGAGFVDPEDEIALVGFEGEADGDPVSAAPFSASFSTRSTRVLSDGNRIERSTTGSFARDGQGRTRREMTLPAIGPWAASGKTPPHVIVIRDPVGRRQYILDPDRKTARRVWGLQGRRFRPGVGPRGMRGMEGRKDVTTTSLGTKTINGVKAEGTRYTRTIPAGAIGNEKPIAITAERWYSPDLHVTVMTRRSDPRLGETVFEMTNIQRQEPDASLFKVPSDYTIRGERPRRGRGWGGRRGGERRWQGRPPGGPGGPPPGGPQGGPPAPPPGGAPGQTQPPSQD